MKKLFLLIPALILSMVMNAAEISVDPATPRSIAIAVSSANPNDVLVLGDGTYTNPLGDDYARLKKALTIKAADGTAPVIKFEVPFRVSDAASVKFIGIKFDGSDLTPDVGYNYYFRVNDANDNSLEFEDCEFVNTDRYMIYVHDGYKAKSLKFKNCEFYDNTNYIITTSTSAQVEACEIDGCYFHNNTWIPVYFPASSVEGKQTCSDLKVINSTFANIDCTPEYRSVIDIKPYGEDITDAIKVVVDHCTFYNNQTINSDHSAIRPYKLSDVTISNCIFAHAESYERRATCCWGGSVSNCLTYNLTKDASKNGHGKYGGDMVLTNNFTADPLFTDAANGDFSFPSNYVTMEISPACGAATDGTDLGDPRWYSVPNIPSTDFATPYFLEGKKALLSGNIFYSDADSLHYEDHSVCGTALWKLHAERKCAVGATVNFKTSSNSGTIFALVILDANNNKVGDTLFVDAYNGYYEKNGDKAFAGSVLLPEIGDYTIKLENKQSYSSAKINGITLSYVGGAVQNIATDANTTLPVADAWFTSTCIREDGKIEYHEDNANSWIKWNIATSETKFYDITVNITTTQAHGFTVDIYENENASPVASVTEGSYVHYEGEEEAALALALGRVNLAGGKNFVVKVTNITSGSQAKLVNVVFAPVASTTIDIPNTLLPADAILSERAWIDNDSILFTARGDEGYNEDEWAKWTIHSDGGWYTFTLNGYNANENNENGQQYAISILSSDESEELTTKTSTWAHPGASSCSTDAVELPEGNFIVKVQNILWGSTGRVLSVVATYAGGALINIPAVSIPFNEALLYGGATRDLESNPQEVHFGNVDAYAQWHIYAAAGLYTFTFDVVGSDYGKYNLTIIDSQDNTIYDDFKGLSNSGSVAHSNILLDAGNYTIKVANVNNGSVGYITNIAATAAEGMLILNEDKTDDGSIAAADYGTTSTRFDVFLKRSFTAGKYYTLCVPFDSYEDQLVDKFGTGYELWKMVSAEQEEDVINLNFVQTPGSEFAAGVPYIIKPTKDVENPIFSQKKIWNNNTTQSFDVADFIGTYYKSEIPAGVNNLYLQNNDLYYSESNDTPIRGMRAWIRLKQQGAAAPKARIVLRDNAATAIDLVNGENKAIKCIENGQVIIIRDGIRYNVMGTKLQ